ncbi:MAG: nicotinate-nicotinamide nucleotide adenylyltransferase, partial [Burkholderiales bacterium]
YTVDTLASLRAELGAQAPLVLLMGADQYAKLDTWHRWQDLFGLCRIAVFARPGWNVNDARVEHVAMPPLDVSASGIRARLGRGEEVSAMLPAAVLEYVERHKLYR